MRFDCQVILHKTSIKKMKVINFTMSERARGGGGVFTIFKSRVMLNQDGQLNQ